jgi:ABC-type nickel/cobalt efflux system permease component RcnA
LPEFLRDTEASFLVFYPEESEVEIKPKPAATQDANDELEPEPIETQPPRVIGEDPIPNPTQLQSTDSSQSLDQRLVSSWSTKLFRVSELNFSIASLGFLLAIFLGALHSFAPGHGKSMMLALSVDKALKRAQLFRLAFNMGASHTVGVLTLGAVIYFGFSQSSDLIISVLAIVLGIFLIGLGAYILRSRVHELKHHKHSHEHSHDHGHDHHHHFGFSNTRLRVFGLLGGMLPTPSALAILVGSAALGNIWYGVLLVVGYGIGMAGVLMTTGYVVQRIFLSIENQRSRSKLLLKLANYFPIGAAIIQIFAGLFLLITSIRLLP